MIPLESTFSRLADGNCVSFRAVNRQFLSIQQTVSVPWARSGIAQDGGLATFAPCGMRIVQFANFDLAVKGT